MKRLPSTSVTRAPSPEATKMGAVLKTARGTASERLSDSSREMGPGTTFKLIAMLYNTIQAKHCSFPHDLPAARGRAQKTSSLRDSIYKSSSQSSRCE